MLLAEKLPVTDFEALTTGNTLKIRKTKQPKIKMVLTIALVLMTAVGNMIIQGLVIHQNNQIKLWQNKVAEKERQLIKLRIEIARLESFDRIQSIAQNELGMRDAGPKDYYLIKAAPKYKKGQTATTGYLAQESSQTSLWDKLSNWLEGFGRTMAKNP